MTKEHLIAMLDKDDITLDPEWIEEQVNRLAGWEYLNRRMYMVPHFRKLYKFQ